MEVVSEPLQCGSKLVDDYIHHYEKVAPLYGEDYRADSTWTDRVKWLDQSEHRRVDRQALVEVLREYNEKHNAHDAVHTSLYMLGQADTLVVTGGQQSGLFIGSMLVIYKAMTIILTARQAQQRLKRSVVPVFWIAGEDHDWDEVNHTYMGSSEYPEPTKIMLQKHMRSRTSVSLTPVTTEEWYQVMKVWRENLPDSDVKEEMIVKIQHAVNNSHDLSGAFAKQLGDIFGEYGLVLLDSADPHLRELESPIFQSIIKKNQLLGRAYQSSADQITALGYNLQADVADDGANLFYLHEDNRLLLLRQDGKFMDRKGLVSFTEAELLDMLDNHPERFSNNVLTRPIMQDSLFPVLASVLGQGEIAYWAITRQAFEVMGLQMPILLPRMSFTLLDRTQMKYMEKYDLSFQDVQYDYEERREQWLSNQDSLHIDHRFNEIQAAFEQMYMPLLDDLGKMQKGLRTLGERNKEKIKQQISYLELKSKEALEHRHEAELRQWSRINTSLFPLGKPQERVYNVYYYLNCYGISFIKDLMELNIDYSEEHRLILV
ncbi:bacillithiol biosynthesis cysteine-adding enzyme BshC [Paenibacillus sp. CMAA1364]